MADEKKGVFSTLKSAGVKAGNTITDTTKKNVAVVDKKRVELGGRIGDAVVARADKQTTTPHDMAHSLSDAIRLGSSSECKLTAEEIDECAKFNEMAFRYGEAHTQLGTQITANPERYTVAEFSRTGAYIDAFIVKGKTNGHAQVVFMGTKSNDDWMHDANFRPKSLDGGPEVVHSGFKSYTEQMWPKISKELQGAKSVTFTGHSLGGAVAQVATVKFAKESPEVPVKVVTFGAPRVGNQAFADTLNRATKGNHARVVLGKDPVPDANLHTAGYVHTSKPIIFDDGGMKVGKAVDTGDSARTITAGLANGALTNFPDHAARNYRIAVESQFATDKQKLQEALARQPSAMPERSASLLPPALPQKGFPSPQR